MASSAVDTGKTRSGWIERREPEDRAFWESKGNYIARRNLVFSIFAEFLGSRSGSSSAS